MIRTTIIGAALALAACSTGGAARSFDDTAVQKLFLMSTPEYYANLSLANQVAQRCTRYRYDAALDSSLNEVRNEVGRGSLSANSQRVGIDLETDVSQRSFSVKHDVDLTSSDLCAAGDAEVLEGSGISAMLVPT